MKELSPLSSLLSLTLLSVSPLPSLAVPPNVDAQAAFSQSPFSSVSGIGIEWMDDAKKAILRGKENLERWYHEGTEYIKQDNLLCENQSFTNVLDAHMW